MYCTTARECGVPQQLQGYYRDISQVSLLSAEEEKVLAEAISRGDRDARSRLIQANLRLVVKIARDYVGRGMGLEDLIGEGNLGLIRAAAEYDPRFGTRFSTYASYWIKQTIRHALINTTSTIRLPAHMYGLLTKWRRAERSLCRERGAAPSFEEVASYLGLSEAQMFMISRARSATRLKLESSLTDQDGSWSPDESMDGAASPEEVLEIREEGAEIRRRLERLDERERLVLTLRHGLAGEPPMTLKEIGLRIGVTREWVRKIEMRAMARLLESHDQESPVPCVSSEGPKQPPRPQTRARELHGPRLTRRSAARVADAS